MVIFSIHFVLLMGLGIWRVHIKGWPKSEAFPCLIILVWANVVLTSLALSAFNQLGNNSLFVLVSLPVHGLLLRAISQYTGTAEEPWSDLIISLWKSTLGKTLILWASIVCLILLAMVVRTTLQIPDSVAIKLPNAFFYLQKGNLFPAPEFSGDGRMFGVPFNGALLWSYLFRFHQPLQLILIWNLLCWMLIFLGGFKLSRSLGISPMGSLAATSLFCFSQQLLFQAITDNDDLLSSVTGTWAAIYILRWLRSPSQNWALLAGLALGISAGAKLFPALFWPGLLALAFLLIWKFCRKSDSRGKRLLQGTVIVFDVGCAQKWFLELAESEGFFFRLATQLARLRFLGPFRRLWQADFYTPHHYYFNNRNLKELCAKEGFFFQQELRLKTLTIEGLWERINASKTGSTLPIRIIIFICAAIAAPIVNFLLPADTICLYFQRQTLQDPPC